METSDEPDIKPGELRCPRCFGKDVVPSKRRGFVDALMAQLGKVPRHCRFCGKRFYVLWEELKAAQAGALAAAHKRR